MSYRVSIKRHLAKTVSYRLLSSLIGFFIIWWISDSYEIGALLSTAELIYKPTLYYLHERVWYKWSKFGLIPETTKPNISKSKPLTEGKLKTNVKSNQTTPISDYAPPPAPTRPTPPPTLMLREGENPRKKSLKYSSDR